MSGSGSYVGFRGARVRALLWAGAMLGLVGCSTVRMVPPKDVAAKSDVFEATDRSSMSGALADESFALGPYRVAAVDRDWDSANGFSRGALSRDDIRSGYVYQFQEGAETLWAQCAALTERSGYSLGKAGKLSSQESTLVCTCGSGDGAAKLQLEHKRGKPTGQVTLARGTLDLKSVHETNAAWGPAEPAGYRVGTTAEDTIGAVEVLRPGRLWLSKALEPAERRQLGCLLAGVMLYEESTEH